MRNIGRILRLFPTEPLFNGYRPLFRQPLFRQNAYEKAQLTLTVTLTVTITLTLAQALALTHYITHLEMSE